MITDRYSGKSYIGSGGMASVYKAFDEVLHRTVAIKELNKQLRGNVDVCAMFLSEARKMASVRHQNVVQVYDVSDEGNVPTIIMEYLEGGSIASRLGRGSLTVDEVIVIIRQVAQGLSAIHAAGLVHRDVKPENIIEHDGIYKIADFGVAMSGEEEALPFVTNKYAAPEVLLEPENISPVTDIYSLGIMAIEMLLGPQRFEDAVREAIEADARLQLPAIHDSAQAFWQQWVASSSELPPLNEVDPAISPEITKILGDMTRRERAARVPDCQTVLKRLEDVAVLSTQRAEAPTEYSAKSKRRFDRKKAEATGAGKTSARKSPLWFRATAWTAACLLVAVVVLIMLPSGGSRFHLEVATTPPGASVTVNGQLLEDDPTPTWFNGAWGDTVRFELEGREPLEVIVSESMEGLTAIENGYHLELAWPQPDWIATSAEAADMLKQGLPGLWPLQVSLETPGSRLIEDASYSVAVGTDLNFQVTSEQPAFLAVIHLGSNDVLTLIYPNPFGFAPQLDANAMRPVGKEIGLIAKEPIGTEWVVFIAAESLQLPPRIPGVENVGGWATVYPFGEEASSGGKLVSWLLDTFGDEDVSANIVQIEVTGKETGL